MMLGCGCKIPLHVREWDAITLGFCSKLKLSSLTKPSPDQIRKLHCRTGSKMRLQLHTFSSGTAFPLRSCFQSKSHAELSVLSDSSSQKKDGPELQSEGLPAVAGGIVALGKFDALHVGHRELAVQASKIGAPFLLSFVGMAEVLGWEPRAPIVAKCDRKRVLSSWAPYCRNLAPREVLVEFSSVRHLTPRQFVEKLSEELGVLGVVAGENYRFGYKAAGDTSELTRLCNEYGISAYIIDSVMDETQDCGNSGAIDGKERGQVSSTRVRYALAKGDIDYVTKLLGRRHRLFLSTKNMEEIICTKGSLSAPKSRVLNLPPKNGLYENCSVIIGDENQLPCVVNIDAANIHVESDYLDNCIDVSTKDFQLLGIEF